MTDDGGATWAEGHPFRVLLETGAEPTNGPVYADLDFVDPLHGWFFNSQGPAVGAPIFMYRTVDGGLHWSQVEMTPATGTAARGALPVGCSPYGMTFLNVTTGWVAGSCGQATLFDVTHDGGVTWTRKRSRASIARSILRNSAHGWTVRCSVAAACTGCS